jgi:hypothetical protein
MFSLKTFLCFMLMAIIVFPGCAAKQSGAMRPPSDRAAQTESEASRANAPGQGDMAIQGGVDSLDISTDLNGDGVPDNPGSNSQTVSGIEPEGVFGAGVGLPTGWPSDVPIMPDFTITASMSKGDGGLVVGAVGEVKMSDVADYYKALEGWEVVSDAVTTPGEGRQGRSITLEKESANLNVYVEPGDNNTHVTLSYKAGPR